MGNAPVRIRQAEMERAIRAAKKLGMVARLNADGSIEFVEKPQAAETSHRKPLDTSRGIRL